MASLPEITEPEINKLSDEFLEFYDSYLTPNKLRYNINKPY